jgi:hypothetical protein
LYPGSPESRYGVDSRSLKNFPTPLLSTDLIVLISFDEYCSNVRFVLGVEEGKLVIDNITRAAFCGALKDITKSLSVIFQSEGYDILNPSIGFSSVKNGFASVVAAIVVVFASRPYVLGEVVMTNIEDTKILAMINNDNKNKNTDECRKAIFFSSIKKNYLRV